jgi:hypothetical protein
MGKINWQNQFPSKYLNLAGFATLLDGARSLPLTVREVKLEKMSHTADTEDAVLYFQEIREGLCINKTRFAALQEITGTDDEEEWPGTCVELYLTKTASGQGTIAIRAARERERAKA